MTKFLKLWATFFANSYVSLFLNLNFASNQSLTLDLYMNQNRSSPKCYTFPSASYTSLQQVLLDMSSLSKGNFENPFSKTSMTSWTPQFSYSVLLKPPSTEMCNTRLVLVLHHQQACLSSTSYENHALRHGICTFQATFLVKWLLKTFN